MKRMRTTFSLFAAALLLVQAGQAQNPDALRAARTITAAELREKLTVVAGPGMEGRETATEGQRRAAAYIEQRFRDLGLKPGAENGSYQQSFPVFMDHLQSTELSLYGIPFAKGQHYATDLRTAGDGSYNASELLYLGFEFDKDTSLLASVPGKWVVLAAGRRENAGANNPTTTEASSLAQQILRRGAAGLIVVTRNFPFQKEMINSGGMYTKARSGAKPAPLLQVSHQLAASLLSKPLNSFADLASLKTGTYATQLNYRSSRRTDNLTSTNVLGLLPGTDKAGEYLFVTAHYDHLGKRDTVIYYGADDDGSGTVSIIELAEAFTAAAQKGKGPRRSIVFMAVSGEEKGLWGSEYYAANPVYPLSGTTADLNIDMVGRIDPSYKGNPRNYVFTIGEDKLSSDLQPISDSVNRAYGLNMELDRRYNDPADKNRFYYRSDHYNFAKNGVPVIFYFNGTHPDYHRPGDTVDKIEFDLMAQRVKLVFFTAWDMANRPQMLKRDRPLNMPPR